MKKQVLTLIAIAGFAVAANSQAIANAGFETWSSAVGEDVQPTNWISYNVFTAALIDPGNTNPTSVTQAGAPDNYQGTYSAKITTISLVTNPSASTIPNTAGILMTGAVSFVPPYLRAGYQNTGRPTTFSYAAKYTPVSGDSAYCYVMVSHWNAATSHRDTIAQGIDYIGTTISAYQVRTINLIYNAVYNNTIPDSALVYFSSSRIINPQVGSAYYVDALSFSGYNGIEDPATNNGVDVYPNPSSTITNFDVAAENAYEVVVYDVNGREVSRKTITNKSAKIESFTMAAGIYTYSIVTKENEVLSRGKFTVTQ